MTYIKDERGDAVNTAHFTEIVTWMDEHGQWSVKGVYETGATIGIQNFMTEKDARIFIANFIAHQK